jgi:hypothetical protein
MRKVLSGCLLLGLLCAWSPAQDKQDKYDGPKPPKPDIPYLLHASELIPAEVVEAKQEDKKNESVFMVPGATSTAKTPLAEPIFLMQADKLNPERMDLWRLDTKGGQREISISHKSRKNSRNFRVMVSRIEGRLYKIEVAQPLENGEYSLSPSDSNQAFCFTVY